MLPKKTIHFVCFEQLNPIKENIIVRNLIRCATYNTNRYAEIKVYGYTRNIKQLTIRLQTIHNINVFSYEELYKQLLQDYPTKAATINLNRKLIAAELNPRSGNTLAAANIFRMDLLYFVGGYYLDNYIDCIASLPKLNENPPYGLYFKKYNDSIEILIGVAYSTFLNRVREAINASYEDMKKKYFYFSLSQILLERHNSANELETIYETSGLGFISSLISSFGEQVHAVDFEVPENILKCFKDKKNLGIYSVDRQSSPKYTQDDAPDTNWVTENIKQVKLLTRPSYPPPPPPIRRPDYPPPPPPTPRRR